MGWFQTADTAIYDALCASLNLDPSSETALSAILPAYHMSDGRYTNPQAGRAQNVIYYALSELQNTSSDYVDPKYEIQTDSRGRETLVAKITKTIPIDVLLTFYGKDADDWAEKVWSIIQVDYGYGCPRSILRQSGMVLEGTPSRPQSLPELEGSLWRRRCDVRLHVNMIDVQTVVTPYSEYAPEIYIRDESPEREE